MAQSNSTSTSDEAVFTVQAYTYQVESHLRTIGWQLVECRPTASGLPYMAVLARRYVDRDGTTEYAVWSTAGGFQMVSGHYTERLEDAVREYTWRADR